MSQRRPPGVDGGDVFAPYHRRIVDMIVISRQKDETISIGDEIEVTVIDIRGDKVRLGLIFPEGVSVHRK
jgi:carbon storage regulator